MSDHHEHASEAVAQRVFDGMSADARAEVEKEAREKGVESLEIVRSALDVLIETAAENMTAQAQEPKKARAVVKPAI